MPPRKAAAPTRRKNGDAKYYQRASDGRWCYTFDLGIKGNGKRHRITITANTYDGPKGIVAKRKAKQDELDKGITSTTGGLTIEQWLNHWVEVIHKAKVKPHTYQSDRSTIRTSIIPFIGKYPIAKLAPEHVREMHKGVRNKPRGNSTRTVQRAHIVLNLALTSAVREGRIPHNIVERVDTPPSISEQRTPLTYLEATTFMRHSIEHGDRNAVRWAVALLLGIRQGEALGLTWDRVNLTEGTIDTEWTLDTVPLKPEWRYADGDIYPKEAFDVGKPDFEYTPIYKGYCFTRPKTRTSKRVVPLPASLWAMLQHHRTVWEPNEYNLLFATPEGRPINEEKDRTLWKQALANAGLKVVDLHAARHTTGTLLLEAGVPEEIRMAIMGHSSAAAQRIYAHINHDVSRTALGNLDGILTPKELTP